MRISDWSSDVCSSDLGWGAVKGRASALAAGAMKACRGSAETVSSTTRRSWTRRRGRDSDERAVFTPANVRSGRTTAVPPLTPEMLVAARFIDFGDSWAPDPAAPWRLHGLSPRRRPPPHDLDGGRVGQIGRAHV